MDKSTSRVKQANVQEADATAEIERLFKALKRTPSHWKAAAILGFLGMVAGVGTFKGIPPKYESSTVVVYRQGITTSSTERGAENLKTLSTTFKEVLLSSTVLQPIVKEKKLYTDLWEGEDLTDAIAKLREDITYEKRAEDTFAIVYVGASAEAARSITEMMSNGTSGEILRVSRLQRVSEADFLANEQKERETDLKNLESEQARFLVAHPEFAEDTKSGSTPGVAIRAAEKEEAAAVAGSAPTVDRDAEKDLQSAKTMADQELGKSRTVLNDKNRLLSELRQKYTDKHPEVKAAADAVRVVEAEVVAKQAASDEAGKKITALKAGTTTTAKESDPYLALEQERKLAPLTPTKGDAGSVLSDDDMVTVETEWARITRDLAELRKRLDGVRADAFAARLKVTSVTSGYSDHFETVNPAFTPTEPKQPAPMLIAIAVMVFGWFLGGALAVALAVFDGRLFDGPDVARFVEVLAVVPRATKKRKVRFPRVRALLLAIRSSIGRAVWWTLTLGRRRERAES